MFSSILKCLIFFSSCQKLEGMFLEDMVGLLEVKPMTMWLSLRIGPHSVSFSCYSKLSLQQFIKVFAGSYPCMVLAASVPDKLFAARFCVSESPDSVVAVFPATFVLWWVQEKLSIFSSAFFLVKRTGVMTWKLFTCQSEHPKSITNIVSIRKIFKHGGIIQKSTQNSYMPVTLLTTNNSSDSPCFNFAEYFKASVKYIISPLNIIAYLE